MKSIFTKKQVKLIQSRSFSLLCWHEKCTWHLRFRVVSVDLLGVQWIVALPDGTDQRSKALARKSMTTSNSFSKDLLQAEDWVFFLIQENSYYPAALCDAQSSNAICLLSLIPTLDNWRLVIIGLDANAKIFIYYLFMICFLFHIRNMLLAQITQTSTTEHIRIRIASKVPHVDMRSYMRANGDKKSNHSLFFYSASKKTLYIITSRALMRKRM